MPVSDGYLTFVLDQLRPAVADVRARRMFGGIGLYAADLFFGIIDDDIVYLKVDDSTRGEYEARGMPAFRPYEGGTSMNYSQLPEEILEEQETLQLSRPRRRARRQVKARERKECAGEGPKEAAARVAEPSSICTAQFSGSPGTFDHKATLQSSERPSTRSVTLAAG